MKFISLIVDYLLGYEVKKVEKDTKVYLPCNKIFGNLSAKNNSVKVENVYQNAQFTTVDIVD